MNASQISKVSDAQRAILHSMRQGNTLHASIIEGQAPSLCPTRSAWTQNYRRYTGNGMQSVRLATLDALLRLGLVEEESRYKSGTNQQGRCQWDTWTINYRLTDKGREL